MEISPGVTVKEGGRVRRGPARVSHGSSSVLLWQYRYFILVGYLLIVTWQFIKQISYLYLSVLNFIMVRNFAKLEIF